MKRAILVSSGTLAGLVAVLTYSGGDANPIVAAAGSGSGAGLGGPPPAESTDPNTAPPADGGTTGDAGATGATGADGSVTPTPASSSPAAAASPTAAAAKPTTAPTKAAAKPAPAATKAVAVPAPTKAAPKPTPTPKPTVAVAKDYIGSLQTHKYGKVQVGIRVKAGKIIAVWPVVYPNGDSQPYSDFSIPVFKSETMKAQSANIANVSGATLTWQSWKKSLQSAMAKAGI
jgi:uncharacterized protein with FMN-binding domain